MRNPSVMNHNFGLVPTVNMPRSVFDRSHGWKGTVDTDFLYPFYVDEVLPGDDFSMRTSGVVRAASALIRPIMDNLYITFFYFYVPNRLLWTNWKKFMGEQVNPADSITYQTPICISPSTASGGIPQKHLFDYMGLPVGPLSGGGGTTGISFVNFHGRAYNLIWSEFFRDENLQNSAVVETGDGPDTFASYNLLRRGKRFDYFTQANPWPIKGGVEVPIPLGTTAPIVPTVVGGANNHAVLRKITDGTLTGAGSVTTDSNSRLSVSVNAYLDPNGGLVANLAGAGAATLNSLRNAISLQRFLERDARGGSRLPELIYSHFGVVNPDFRVQRPELLGIKTERLNINPVAQTAPKPSTGTLTDQGTLTAILSGAHSGAGFKKGFTEHGVLLGLFSINADLTYSQGLDYMFFRRTRYDYYFPEFAGLGERPLYNKEIYANLPDGSAANQKDGVFGYVPRWDELRFKRSSITGDFRTYNGNGVNATRLDVWHLSQAFATQPLLNATFIQSDTPMDRVVSVPSFDYFHVDIYNDLKCARVMPTYGVPGLTRL